LASESLGSARETSGSFARLSYSDTCRGYPLAKIDADTADRDKSHSSGGGDESRTTKHGPGNL
jgi:hypothetical protein